MSIEQKIAQILAESKAADSAETIAEANVTVKDAQAGDQQPIRTAANAIDAGSEVKSGGSGSVAAQSGDQQPIRTAANAIPAEHPSANEANAKNNVQDEDEAENGGPGKVANKVTANANAGDQSVIRQGTSVKGVNEDVEALVNGEDLSEEFKAKAATIFEAAIVTRVKEEVARIEEEFDAKLEEAVAQNQEGLVEKVDGYLDYVVEQWMNENALALESGIKSEILEGFVAGLKNLFEESYIDIPEEKFDVLGAYEEEISDLEAKLNEAVEANIEMAAVINEATRQSIIDGAAEGLAETDKEKFYGLAEELAFEDAETFETKVQTIRENYFTNKTTSTIVESVVTDSPVELTEDVKKAVSTDPRINSYASVLDKFAK